MPYAIIIIGTVLFVAGIRNKYKDLLALIEGDFTGPGSFLNWLAVMAVLGGIGYIPRLRSLSVAFMTLLLLVLVISHKGVFQQLQSFVNSGVPATGASPALATGSTGAPSQTLTPLQQINQNLTSGISP